MGCSVSKFSHQGTHEIDVEDNNATSMPTDIGSSNVMALEQNRTGSQNSSTNNVKHRFSQLGLDDYQKTDVTNPENTSESPQQNELVFQKSIYQQP